MRPFLLLATRPEDEAAIDEYEAIRRHGHLERRELQHVRLESAPMPALDLDDYSGVLVGGSPYCTSDPDADKSPTQRRVEAELARLLDVVVARDVPFLGACYGIGTLGVHQGGVVDGTYGEPVGSSTVRLTDAGRADPVLGVLPEEFEAFVGHKEALTVPPPGAVVLATSGPCPVQAFRVKQNLYATQFHPELDLAGLTTRVQVYREAGYFPPETADDVVAAAARADVVHPPALLRAFVRRYAR